MIHCDFLRNRNGNLYVPYLNWNGDRWTLNFNRLDNNWNSNDRLVSCESIRSPSFVREFSFSCIFLPTTNHSADFCKMITYFTVYVCVHPPSFPQ